MAKGRYIKAAERACARKARFETAAAAEAFAEYRFKAYLCPVCHHWHLTSRGTPTTEPEAPKPEPPGAKLRDLDWSPILDPKPSQPKAKPVHQPPPPRPDPRPTVPPKTAECVRGCGKDGKALLLVDGKLVKSGKVPSQLRPKLHPGVTVIIEEGIPPQVKNLVQ